MNKLKGEHLSFWLKDDKENTFPKLGKTIIDTDILIVGGGLAGMLLAYFLEQSGKSFVLLESRKISNGVTGHSSAKITSLHGLIYSEIIESDREMAQHYADANQGAIHKYEEIISELSIECDFKKMPAYTYASTEEDQEMIEKEVRAAKSLGLAANADKLNLPFPTFGAVKFENQARFDPYKFLGGISKYLKAKKCLIYEDTPVRKLNYKDKHEPILAETDESKVYASKVVVLTNYPIIDPDMYFAKLVPRRSYVLLAEPEKEIPLGMYYSTEENFHSFRPHPHNGKEMWLFGGELHMPGRDPDTEKRYLKLQKWTEKYFKPKKIFYRWSTHDSRPLDNIPIVGKASEKYDRVFIGTGFKGWGITNTMVSAQLLSDLLNEKQNQNEKLYDPSRKSLVVKKEMITFNIPTISKLISENFKSFKGDVDDLNAGEAKVIEIEGKKVAVFKDEEENIHAVSAHCQHMGCIVHWNTAEKTWDCPCHASRYTIDGEVIHAPASTPLEKIKVE